MVLCAMFGLTVSEAKNEIMCLRTKGMPGSTATFSVEAAGQVYSQTNEFVYFGGNVNHNADLSIEVDRRIRNVWPHAAPSPAQLPDSLHRLAKEQSHRPPDFLSGHADQDGK